ncbi:MAG: hypothetical protein ACWGQW_21660, partial [bacterium]
KIEEVVAKINEKYGRNVIARMSEIHNTGWISTGIITFDLLLKGWKRGTIAEIRGQWGTGKTTLIYRALAQAESGALIAVEGAGRLEETREWGKVCGIDWEKVYVTMPSNANEALDMLMDLVATNTFDVIALDSLGASSTQDTQDRLSEGKEPMQAGLARHVNPKIRLITSKFQPKDLLDASTYNNTVVLLSNHFYVGGMGGYYQYEETSGGRGKDFLSCRLIDLKTAPKTDRIEVKKDKASFPIGRTINVVFKKESVTGREGDETFIHIIRDPHDEYPQRGVCNVTMLKREIARVLSKRPKLEEVADNWQYWYEECYLALWGKEPEVRMRSL